MVRLSRALYHLKPILLVSPSLALSINSFLVFTHWGFHRTPCACLEESDPNPTTGIPCTGIFNSASVSLLASISSQNSSRHIFTRHRKYQGCINENNLISGSIPKPSKLTRPQMQTLPQLILISLISTVTTGRGIDILFLSSVLDTNSAYLSRLAYRYSYIPKLVSSKSLPVGSHLHAVGGWRSPFPHQP